MLLVFSVCGMFGKARGRHAGADCGSQKNRSSDLHVCAAGFEMAPRTPQKGPLTHKLINV